MSYGTTAALQVAVYNALVADSAVAALSGGAIHDALPPGPVPALYVSLGAERARNRSDMTGAGALYDFPITVFSDEAGFQSAKALAVAVSDGMLGSDLTLSRGRVVSLNFLRAVARRTATGRQIEVWFRAHVDEDTA
ncbi:MAG: DUF3168 domain-containing protein [Roseicyclus sp.]